MIRRRYMRTRQLKAGMKMDHAIFDAQGRALVARGAVLDEYVIESLLKLGIMSVYIQEGEPDEPSDNAEPKPEEKPCPLAEEHIEKLRAPDRSKIMLTDSVRKRVSQGIQYIYSGSDSNNLTNATESIATDLMSAIENNDAVAVDIGALKTSDEYTFKHSVDVATIAMILGKQQGLSKKEIYEIGVAGLLHDIGKTKIPLDILNKPARLTEDEFEVMKQHSVYGYKMAKDRGEFSQAVLLGILQHHEKINGEGYPMRVGINQLSPYAKILAIADIYDALVTARPYKEAFSQRDAVELIMSMTDELDMEAMKSFLESVILYPVDSVVELSNGERARVVQNSPHYILRPTVVGLKSGRIYNLGEDLACASIIIM